MREIAMKNLLCILLVLPLAAFGQTALTTAQIAKRASPSVVVIQGKTDSGDVLGSGFIVSKDGKIVTNLHVIREMKTASVELANGDSFDSVSVLATDEPRDLAVVNTAVQNGHKSDDPCCKRGLCVPGTGVLRLRSAAVS
jgi:S1-C subfamily serine protease